MKRFLLAVAAFAVGVLVSAAYYERQPVRPVVTSIEVTNPTGERITGASGSGDPQPQMKTTKLRVIKKQGEATVPPDGSAPWRVAVNGVTYIAVPVD